MKAQVSNHHVSKEIFKTIKILQLLHKQISQTSTYIKKIMHQIEVHLMLPWVQKTSFKHVDKSFQDYSVLRLEPE